MNKKNFLKEIIVSDSGKKLNQGIGTGICDICGNVGRLQTCMLCGRRVCERCYIFEKGVCRVCIAGRQYK